MRVAVVGAGVIGVTSAIAVKNAFPGYEVEILADGFSPDTTGDGSAGLWGPYLLGDTPPENILRWSGETHRWLEDFWKAGFAPEAGICLLPVYRMSSEFADAPPVWTQIVYGAQKLSKDHLEELNREHGSNYKECWQFLTFTSEPVHLLPWLTEKFLAAGGKLRKRKVRVFHELIEDGYDLIINCAGLGARQLANDATVTPIRGQVTRVMAPWAMHGILVDDDDGNYIIPNIDDVVLGGTHQEGDFDCDPRQEDSKFIYEGCCRILPGLKGMNVIREWVGLRPGRPRVRLEPEVHRSPCGEKFTVIHNYGHGGAGVTLSWGCALDVVELMRNTKRIHETLKSNL